MFCSNCGKQLEENTKFCDECGAKQGVENTNITEPAQIQQEVPVNSNTQTKGAPKKKTNIIVVLAVVLVAFLVGKFAIAPAMVDDNGGSSSNNNNSSTYSSSNDTTNSEYDEILANAHIVHFPNIFGVGISTASFVSELDDGRILCSDYGYKDDVVIQMVETLYIPVSGYTDSELTQLESSVKAECASFEAISCCTLKYNMGTNYYTVTMTYSDLDKAENCSELYQANFIDTNTFISMTTTQDNLIVEGAVKK